MGMGLLCPQDHPLCRQRASAGCFPPPMEEEALPQVRDVWIRNYTCFQVTSVQTGGRVSGYHGEALLMFFVICLLTTVCMCPLLNTYVRLRQVWTNRASPLKRESLPSLLLHVLGPLGPLRNLFTKGGGRNKGGQRAWVTPALET